MSLKDMSTFEHNTLGYIHTVIVVSIYTGSHCALSDPSYNRETDEGGFE